MKLRTYLLKRTIHMIITILIVLVLLFVLYRMMPGNQAAAMMMNPKMTQNDINMVLVRYGFGRWSDYPGDYTVTNLDPQTIGRYSVTVEATDDAGQTDSFTTEFDVNAPPETDFVAPRILDVGITSASIGQKAEFYLMAYDIGTIKIVDVTIICPNHVVVDGIPVPFTEPFTMDPVDNMTDEANKTFYFSGTTPSTLSLGEGGDSNFSVIFAVQDLSRNTGTSVLTFNANTGLETLKIWDISVNIPYSNGAYSYPVVNQAVSLTSKIMGGTPSFSMTEPDMSSTSITSMTGPDILYSYNGTYTVLSNGLLNFNAKVGDLSTNFSFAVNSAGTMPAHVQDDDASSPVLSDLYLMAMDKRGNQVVSPEYPFVLKDLRLRINATAVDSDGVRCSNITAYVLRPDGSTNVMGLTHPNYVKMRTMAEQFVTYMKTMLLFDFGTSYIYQRPAWDVILERVPSTALLFGSAMIISDIIGILAGVVVAWRRGTALEMGTIIVTLFFYSMPIFWFALIMQWVFYAQLGWFPLAGMGGIDPTSGLQLHGLSYFLDVMWHLTMPLITLVILGLAGTIP
jgi:ABC-type dipeptide/oligopeptide/nickel transport system permease component